MIEYTTDMSRIRSQQLTGFFEGWLKRPDTETHLKILQNSFRVVAAIDREKDRVIGFITAISDGMLSVYLPLLEVLPDYRRQGVGTELVNRILAETDNFYMIDLCCNEATKPFYAKLGFLSLPAMVKRNYNFSFPEG
ncbi:MAG: acetyltransferase [Candidatus Cloacimonas sp. SDB]|nr:MAG: acetyltransferase [Candidatus Cloacimonas sp. SDB]